VIDFGSAYGESSLVVLERDVRAELDAAMAPKVPLGVTACAEQHRWLPSETSSEAGWYRVSRTPYMRAVMEALADTSINQVVLMKGSQTGGTTAAENWILWTMLESPAAFLSVWPTEKLLRRFSRTRLEPMIDSTPRLKEIFARTGLREAGDAIAYKEFPGGSLNLITARSADDLRSISAPRVHVSEVDRLMSLIMDGDPLELLRSRGETFWDYKELLESTPLLFGTSKIADAYEKTNQNRWFLPCPGCEGMQVLRWSDGVDEGRYDLRDDERRFVWEVDSAKQVIPESVRYKCEHCPRLIEEFWKASMLEAGEWRAAFPDRRRVGFHLPAFPSPLIQWWRIVDRFIGAQRTGEKMRVFVNNICGLPYREKTKSITPHFLMARAEPYRAQVPKGVKVIVVGGDVQTDHVVLTWWGYGAGEETWCLRHELVEGDTSLAGTWRKVREALNTPLVDEQGKERHFKAGCIDSRHATQKVRLFCKEWVGQRGAKMIPIVGKEGRGRPVIESIQALRTRQQISKRATRMVGTDTVKDLLASRLLVETRGPEYVHFPVGLDPAFYEQLTAEERKTVFRKKRIVLVWEKKSPDVVNDAWDTMVYAYAALVSLGTRVLQELAKLAQAEPADVVAVRGGDSDGDDEEGGAGGSDPAPRPPSPPAPIVQAGRAPVGKRRVRGRVIARSVY
jgi:phage terminase large subunit GpA-like protein